MGNKDNLELIRDYLYSTRGSIPDLGDLLARYGHCRVSRDYLLHKGDCETLEEFYLMLDTDIINDPSRSFRLGLIDRYYELNIPFWIDSETHWDHLNEGYKTDIVILVDNNSPRSDIYRTLRSGDHIIMFKVQEKNRQKKDVGTGHVFSKSETGFGPMKVSDDWVNRVKRSICKVYNIPTQLFNWMDDREKHLKYLGQLKD